MKRVTLSTLAIVASAGLLVGCGMGALQTANYAAQGFQGAKGAYQAYGSYQTMKAFKEANPLFADYERVNLDVRIRPGEDAETRKVAQAFKANFAYVVETDLKATDLEAETCLRDCPADNGLVLQFKEKGYDNAVSAILADGKLRGTLYYVDGSTGKVIKEEPVENAQSYADLMQQIHISVYTKALKSTTQGMDADAKEAAIKKANKNKADPVIKKEYQPALGQA